MPGSPHPSLPPPSLWPSVPPRPSPSYFPSSLSLLGLLSCLFPHPRAPPILLHCWVSSMPRILSPRHLTFLLKNFFSERLQIHLSWSRCLGFVSLMFPQYPKQDWHTAGAQQVNEWVSLSHMPILTLKRLNVALNFCGNNGTVNVSACSCPAPFYWIMS